MLLVQAWKMISVYSLFCVSLNSFTIGLKIMSKFYVTMCVGDKESERDKRRDNL